jgi:pre-rRNA-processing protein TSR4
MNEPPSRRSGTSDDGDDEDVDDDDDGGCDDIDAKVERMLSRYLDAEDDEEILSALRGGPDAGRDGGSDAGGGGDGGGGERYERPPPEERAFLSFTRRLRRAPGQVARYAYGGSPLWSVPTSSPPSSGDGTSERRGHRGSGRERKEKFQKNKSQRNNHPSPLPAVPDCACGAGRVFEFQVLPSLLHVLDVDGYATVVGGREKKENDDDVFDLINSGGMNWGSIAIYSCSLSCDDSREEFVIVQEAVGDAPMRKNAEKGDDSGGDD